jgi:hypothetical protein
MGPLHKPPHSVFMKLPNNIKIKGKLWNISPLLSTYTCQAIYPNIYVPKYIYENINSKNPRPEYLAMIIHEQTHIERQKKHGWILWGLKYIFISQFRFNEELIAIKSGMKYLKKHSIKVDITRKAKFLSSYVYLWCVSYEKAKQELDMAWQQA